MDEKTIGIYWGMITGAAMSFLGRASSLHRKVKIDRADIDAFSRLTAIADRAEKNLKEQTELFRQRLQETEEEKRFYQEQVEKLTMQVSKLQGMTDVQARMIESLREEINSLTLKNGKAA